MIEPNSKKEDYNIDSERIRELISKYEQIKNSGEIKKYNEESTKKDFILPLFKALGWNVDNRGKRNDTVSAEETISKKRVDYGFRINGIPKFFLEAKSLKEENIQTNPKYVTQAIDYAWMKSCSWAILTNFETIAVYNSDWKSGYFGGNQFFVLRPNDFLTDSRFINLSKGAFENNELDKTASKYGKKQVKNPINKQLLQDMIHFREVLSKDIVRNNQDKNLTQDDIDETVQRILDRLIFIRNAEDRGLEENQLQSNVRQWYAKGKGHLVKEISRIYKDYDDKYNSKLFARHLCDDLYIDNEPLQEVIEGLNQSKDNSYRYDFSIIESDVLGNIYEQYLGNILKSTPKRAKLEESKTHRKEQGIYYTPSYIVDYIVKNTVGEFIKTHTPEEIRKVRILDPACGSGSFLIRAYKELENYWKKQYGTQETLKYDEGKRFYSMKVEILKNNIFGVDLDPKAVEIAQLNLLLQISERKHRLPLLQNNIKVGNSLFDDPSISDRAFNWGEQFPEIMKEGGFDIVIGNPPYIDSEEMSKSQPNERSFLSTKFITAKGNWDIYCIFVEQSHKLLREQGKFGMIIPNKILSMNYAKSLREYLYSYSISKIADYSSVSVFNADNYPIVLITTKYKNEENTTILDQWNGANKEVTLVSQRTIRQRQYDIKKYETWSYLFSKFGTQLLTKIKKNSTNLSSLKEEVVGASTVSEAYELKKYLKELDSETGDYFKFVNTGTIDRYFSLWGIEKTKYIKDSYNRPLILKKDLAKYFPRRYKQASVSKLILGGMAKRLECFLDECEYLAGKSTVLIFPVKINSYALLGILNSKLMSYVHRLMFSGSSMSGGYINISPSQILALPIKDTYRQFESKIEVLVHEIISLYNNYKSYYNKENTISEDLLRKISKVDNSIDTVVYEMYGLTEGEISEVEKEMEISK